MKLSINKESSDALRTFAADIPSIIESVTISTEKVVQVYQSVSGSVGPHGQDFRDMLTCIKNAQVVAADAIQELPRMLMITADKIDSYVENKKTSSAEIINTKRRFNGFGNRVLETIGVRRPPERDFCGFTVDANGIIKGNNYSLYMQTRKKYFEERLLIEESNYTLTINPALIEGINNISDYDIDNPAQFWCQHESGGTKESFVKIASQIPMVQSQIDLGVPLHEILNDPNLGKCASIYFNPENMPHVTKGDGFFEFNSNGRHRILAARSVGYDIPVRVTGEFKEKDC